MTGILLLVESISIGGYDRTVEVSILRKNQTDKIDQTTACKLNLVIAARIGGNIAEVVFRGIIWRSRCGVVGGVELTWPCRNTRSLPASCMAMNHHHHHTEVLD